MTAAGWTPTADNYLNRVPKARILEAVTEAKGIAAAELIDHMKKGDMAEQAERLLADTGWMPEPLRTPGVESGAVTDEPGSLEPDASPSEPTADELPAFLNAANWASALPNPCKTGTRSEAHTSELQSQMRISYAVF